MEGHTQSLIQDLAYLLASVAFIFGLKGLTHPRTAVHGNLIGSLGMTIAVVATVWFMWMSGVIEWPWILTGVIAGSVVGLVMGLRTPMTGMPQMVGLLNGFGGGASFLVAGAELLMATGSAAAGAEVAGAAVPAVAHSGNVQFLVATAASGLIGSVTLFGSLVAAGKLQELTFTIRARKATELQVDVSVVLPQGLIARLATYRSDEKRILDAHACRISGAA